MMLAIDERYARDTVLLVVVGVFVATFDELLLCLLESQWANKAVSIVGHVDVGHIPGVVHARFALKVVCPLIDEMRADLPVFVAPLALLHTVTSVNRVLSP